MPTSATDLIVPTGLLIWLVTLPLAVFFIFLWRGGTATKGIAFSSILGLVMSVISFTFAISPVPVMWVYDNQTIVYVNAYIVPQNQAVDYYYALFALEFFLLISACLKLVFETSFFAKEEELG